MIKKNIILLTIFLTIVGCGTKKENKESVMDKEIAVISTKFGDIKLEFFDEIAPKHVESFKLHAQNGYYDGTIYDEPIEGSREALEKLSKQYDVVIVMMTYMELFTVCPYNTFLFVSLIFHSYDINIS